MSISEFIDKAQTQLPKDTLREVPESYLEEPRSILKGSKNSILALPQSTKEVSTIVISFGVIIFYRIDNTNIVYSSLLIG